MTPNELRQQVAELQRHVWRKAGVRKWLVGRAGVCKITMIAVQRWPAIYEDTEFTCFMQSLDAQDELRDYIVTQMRGYRGYDRKYGSLWVIILSAVAGQIIRVLLEWWLERRENQQVMSYMRTFRGKDGQECL